METQSPTTTDEFAAEQAHLSDIYQQLVLLRDTLTDEIESAHHGARKDLLALSDEVRLNFGGADETMETLAAIETLNLVIDTYNNYHDISVDKLARIMLLLEQPYFAKVRLRMRPGRPVRDVYIGTTGVTDKSANPLVVDWRSPIAETYYKQEMGQTSYMVGDRKRTVELLLRRQFDIVRDELRSYFDADVAIEDTLLLHALRRQHTEKLRAITATIQREQNEIIRHEDVPVLLVSGIAGSGKTSVMLQRIAYLLYRQRDKLDARQVWLFTPSPVFGRYIDTVLPQLGESNPNTGTWLDFLASLGIDQRGDGAKGDARRLDMLEETLPTLTLTQQDFRSISVDGELILKPSQVASAWNSFAQFPAGPRRTALSGDKMHEAIERKFGRMSRDERWQEELIGLDIERQVEIFGHSIEPESEEETIALTRTYVANRFSAAHTAVDALEWLKLDRIGARMLDTQSLSAAEYLWLRLLITGHGNEDARYVVIDEVQDYSVVQLRVLARYFRGAHFLLLGDPHQATTEHAASWDEIRDLFTRAVQSTTRGDGAIKAGALGAQDSKAGTTRSNQISQPSQISKTSQTSQTPAAASLTEARLLTSYRSSPEVTKLFVSLLSQHEQAQLKSVQEPGKDPIVQECDPESYLDVLKKRVSAAAQSQGVTAIITADRQRAHWLARQLGSKVRLLGRDEALPAQGVIVVDLKLAKGLEFDHVIIPDAQAEVYPNSDLARRRLYTAISRATQLVEVYSQGTMTSLLKKN